MMYTWLRFFSMKLTWSLITCGSLLIIYEAEKTTVFLLMTF